MGLLSAIKHVFSPPKKQAPVHHDAPQHAAASAPSKGAAAKAPTKILSDQNSTQKSQKAQGTSRLNLGTGTGEIKATNAVADIGKVINGVVDHAVAGGQAQHLDQIKQAKGDDCKAASAQQQYAHDHQQDYARVVSDLDNNGKAKLSDGSELKLSQQNRDEIAKQNLQGADKLNAEFQAAYNDRANGGAKYDFNSDKSTGADGEHKGVTGEQASKVDHALGVSAIEAAHGKHVADVEKAFHAAKAQGQLGVTVPIDNGEGGHHAVNVTDVGPEHVTFLNPQSGKSVSMNREEFDKRVVNGADANDDVGAGGNIMAGQGGGYYAPIHVYTGFPH